MLWRILNYRGGTSVDVSAWLERFVREQRALAGIVYERGVHAHELTLVAAYQLSPAALASARHVYRGQGLAGLAFERNATLSTCTGHPARTLPWPNLSPEEAAVALPIQDASGEVQALAYLVFPQHRRLRDDELINMLDRAASRLGRKPPISIQPAPVQPQAASGEYPCL